MGTRRIHVFSGKECQVVRKIAVMYSGSSQHWRTYKTSEFAQYIDQLIPVRQLEEENLDAFDVLIIPSQSHTGLLDKNIQKIYDFANTGKVVVTFGPQHRDWLPMHNWESRPTNFWWWLEPNADSGLRLVEATHDLFKNYLTLEDATWHQHGVYWPSEGCEVLVSTDDGGAVLYIDRVNTNGIWVNTTLDPDYHFGSYFMPATERFLRGFLPWLKKGQI